MDAHIDAHLELVRVPQGLSVSAYVISEKPRDLRWRLDMKSQNSGGRSNVSQGGRSSGASDARVAHVLINSDSQGTVTLLVYEGETAVATDHITFDEGSDSKGKIPPAP